MTASRLIIQPLYTLGSGPPESLEVAELAFSEADRNLYIGLSDGTIYTFPLLSLVQVLTSDRDWGTIVNRPTTLADYGVTLALADIPTGIDYQTLQNRPDVSALDELLDFPDLTSFPVTGESQKLYIALDTGLFYRWAAGTYHQLTGRAAEWGEISGVVDDQGDLKARLDTLQSQITALANEVENRKIKVGNLYFSTDAANPASKLGYGTWEAYAAGRAIVGVDSADPDFDAPGKTTGAKTHQLTVGEMPEHDHRVTSESGSIEATGTGAFALYKPGGTSLWDSQAVGGGQPHNNLQPSIAVYCWRRTA